MTTPILRAAGKARSVTVDVLSGGGDVVVLAPHPDDESRGRVARIARAPGCGARRACACATARATRSTDSSRAQRGASRALSTPTEQPASRAKP